MAPPPRKRAPEGREEGDDDQPLALRQWSRDCGRRRRHGAACVSCQPRRASDRHASAMNASNLRMHGPWACRCVGNGKGQNSAPRKGWTTREATHGEWRSAPDVQTAVRGRSLARVAREAQEQPHAARRRSLDSAAVSTSVVSGYFANVWRGS
eukprot:362018-Chlamydomonas_euryale.AAC.8